MSPNPNSLKPKKRKIIFYIETKDDTELKRTLFQYNVGNISEEELLEDIKNSVIRGDLDIIGVNLTNNN
ncbi:hypothetical protein J7L13_01630 [bacterium]|nr:hypothetical protein [bacterium]